MEWEEECATKERLERNNAMLEEEIQAISSQNEAYRSELAKISRPINHSHLEHME